MANLSDVEDVFVEMVTGFLYPNGTSQPSVIPQVNNIYIYAGWARPVDLENDLKANNAHVTIFPTNIGRNTTRFPQDWHEQQLYEPTIFLTLTDNQIEITGTPTIPQAVMIIVNKIGYAYQIIEGDTLDSIASALASIIPNTVANANVITINGAFSIVPRVTYYGRAIKEIKRQEVMFNFITWTNSRDKRTLISDVIEKGLGAISRFLLPFDNYWGQICYAGLREHDEFEKQWALYRRDLMFKVEYPTTISNEYPSITNIETPTQILDKIN